MNTDGAPAAFAKLARSTSSMCPSDVARMRDRSVLMLPESSYVSGWVCTTRALNGTSEFCQEFFDDVPIPVAEMTPLTERWQVAQFERELADGLYAVGLLGQHAVVGQRRPYSPTTSDVGGRPLA